MCIGSSDCRATEGPMVTYCLLIAGLTIRRSATHVSRKERRMTDGRHTLSDLRPEATSLSPPVSGIPELSEPPEYS